MATRVNGNPETPASAFQFRVYSTPADKDGKGPTFLPEGQVGFTDVDGLTIETETVQYKEGNDMYVRTLPGRTMPSEVTFSRGMDRNGYLAAWKAATTERTAQPDDQIRNHVFVEVYRRQGVEGVAEADTQIVQIWKIPDAWVSRLETDAFSGGSSEVTVQRMVLACDGPCELLFPPPAV